MASAQELARLHDIHMPTPIGWWPLAPGWYGLALLLMAFISIGIWGIKRHYTRGKLKREALRLLASYEREYANTGDAPNVSAHVSALLKRVALVYFPRSHVASLRGEAWITFLSDTSKGLDFNTVRFALLEVPYQAASKDTDIHGLFPMVRAWISQRRGRCLS